MDNMQEQKEQNKKNGELNSDVNQQSDQNKIEIETESNKINNIEDELRNALEKNAELEKQFNEYKDAYIRKLAEFENYKRRTDNDQLNLLKYAAEPFIKSILTVYDDLERSLEHINDDNSFESLKKGLELVYEKFTKILDTQGVKKIDAKGKPFDVELHEALMQQPTDGVPAHTVLDVIEQGYLYKDKVIRHAKVIVSAEMISQDQNNSSQNDDEKNKG